MKQTPLMELLSSFNDEKLDKALYEVVNEYLFAVGKYGPFASAHEGYAVLLEEMDELWDEIKKKQGQRHTENLEKEAIQVAAMGLRFLIDVGEEGFK